jgi:hypothetical protein
MMSSGEGRKGGAELPEAVLRQEGEQKGQGEQRQGEQSRAEQRRCRWICESRRARAVDGGCF